MIGIFRVMGYPDKKPILVFKAKAKKRNPRDDDESGKKTLIHQHKLDIEKSGSGGKRHS